MANPFEMVVEKMIELGFYDYLFPFIITSAIFYALFKKSKIMGESIAINAALSLSIAFMIFGFPVLVGFSLATPFSLFFTQATVWIMIFMFGILIASFFYPDLGKFLSEQFTRRSTMWALVALGVGLFITSGLVNVFTQGLDTSEDEAEGPSTPTDVILILSAIIIFIVLLIIAASTVRGS